MLLCMLAAYIKSPPALSMSSLLQALLLSLLVSHRAVVAHQVIPSCGVDEEVCHFTLEISEAVVLVKGAEEHPQEPIERSETGPIFNGTNCTWMKPVDKIDPWPVWVSEKSIKRVHLYNGSLPGPPIVVYEGQQVVVRLMNSFMEQATTIHFHGAAQRNMPWMDGVPGVSQCALNPGERFTYRFVASPAGTHWYHSHDGLQQNMGATGMFIVLERDSETTKSRRDDSPLPTFGGDFFMLVQDWTMESAESIFIKRAFQSHLYDNQKDEKCDIAADENIGPDAENAPAATILINGRGHDTCQRDGSYTTYEVFKVKHGGYFRFRVIMASMSYPLQVSVDHHPIYVIASDGNHLKTQKMDSIIISYGERYDFYIEATDPIDVGNYWIRAQTLEVKQTSKMEAVNVQAILYYEGAAEVEPTTSPRPCTEGEMCRIFNCPYASIVTADDHIVCRPMTDLLSVQTKYYRHQREEKEVMEYFLNFHSGKGEPKPPVESTMNRILYATRVQGSTADEKASCIMSAHSDRTTRKSGLRQGCHPHLYLPTNKNVQLNLVFTAYNSNNKTHTIDDSNNYLHLHGNRLQVLKVTNLPYDPQTETYTTFDTHVSCRDKYCHALGWTNRSWAGGEVPGLTVQGAPLKDSLLVPGGSYVVTRFRTDNPGYWVLRYHGEADDLQGASFVLKVGEEGEMNARPENMRTCGDFTWSEQDFLEHENGTDKAVYCTLADGAYKIPTYLLFLLASSLIISNGYLMCSTRLMKKSCTYLEKSNPTEPTSEERSTSLLSSSSM